MKYIRQAAFDEGLLERVRGEFLEMPGLRLTCQQAQRLWGLDRRTCMGILEYLVDTTFLCRADDGMYLRLTNDRARSSSRRAKAHIKSERPAAKEAV
jgi:hypothetical protein